MAAEKNEKKRGWVSASRRGVGAICRHFFIRGILQPLKTCKGSAILRAMAARSTNVKKNDGIPELLGCV